MDLHRSNMDPCYSTSIIMAGSATKIKIGAVNLITIPMLLIELFTKKKIGFCVNRIRKKKKIVITKFSVFVPGHPSIIGSSNFATYGLRNKTWPYDFPLFLIELDRSAQKQHGSMVLQLLWLAVLPRSRPKSLQFPSY